MNIVFSILHYQAIDITEKCIDSLMKFTSENIKIVVVDNASPNGSGKILEKKYFGNNNIYIIKNVKNQGFAKGNNLGYKFAKEKLNAEIIVVMNNDVIIEQENFIDVLKGYEYKNIHIIAPDIVTPLGVHQNPLRRIPLKSSKIIYDLVYNFSMIILLRILILNRYLVKYLENRRNSRTNLGTSWNMEQKNIIPHGAIVIFTREYINFEDYAFLPITFMFGEEDILYEYIKKKEYTIVYYPKLKALHMEDISIKEVTKSELKKRQFMSLNKVRSILKILQVRIKN